MNFNENLKTFSFHSYQKNQKKKVNWADKGWQLISVTSEKEILKFHNALVTAFWVNWSLNLKVKRYDKRCLLVF